MLHAGCGPAALKKMVDIKMLDMKTAVYVTVYTKYLRKGLVVQKVGWSLQKFHAELSREQTLEN